MANEEFADKVLAALQKSQKAVDLTAQDVPQDVPQDVQAQGDIIAFSGAGAPEPDGPLTGGFKDILILPNYGGTAATTPSQINFYWKSPTTPDTSGVDLNVRATLYNYAQTTGNGVTTPILVFGGYDGTNHYLPSRSWNAAATGTTAKIFLDPFRGDITLDYLELNVGTGASTKQGNLWYDSTGDKLRFAISSSTASGFAKTVAFTDDIPGSVNMFFNWTDSLSNTSTPDAAQDTFTLASGLGMTVFINSTTDTATFAVAGRALDNTATQTLNLLASQSVLPTGTGISGLNDVTYVPNTRTLTLTSGILSANFVTANLSGTAVTANFITANTQFNGFLSGNVSGTAVTANFITANTQFNGTLVGLASTASAVTIGAVLTGTYYPTFVNTNAAGLGLTLVTDTNINFNANTNTLTVPVVAAFLSGNVSGTAVTANFVTANTQFTGFLSGNVSGTALTANFITANTQFNGTLVGFLSGNASGTAATFTNIYGNFVGSATTASAVTVGSVSAGTYYPTFVNVNTAAVGLTIVTDPNINFNSATNTLTTDVFSGFLTGNVSGTAVTATFLNGFLQNNVSGTAVTANFITANTQFTGFLSGNVTGTAVTANFITANTQFTGTLVGFHSGNASGTAATYTNFYGNFVGVANTASAITIGAVATGTYYPTFVNTNAAGLGLTLVTDTNISFDAATNTLTTSVFSGFLTGNVSGTAVTATFLNGFLQNNVSGTAVTANFVTANTQFTGFLSGNVSGTALTANFITANTQFTGTLVGFHSGNASGTAATFTNIYGSLVGTASTAQNVNTVATGANVNQHFLLMSNTNGGSGVAVSSAGSGLTFAPNTNRLYAGSYQANGIIVGSASNTIDLVSAGTLTLGSGSNGVLIPGNLTVTGTTITIDSTVSTIDDPVVVIGAAAGGTHLMSDDGKDRGIEFRWSTGAGNATTGFFGFKRSTGRFTFIPNGTNVSEVFSGSYGIFEGNLTGNAVTASFIQATSGFFGNFTGTVTGTATTAASITVSQQTTGTLYPTFVNTNAGSAVGLSVFTDADINFNSATNVLTVPVVSGFLTGNASGTAATYTAFYGPLVGVANTSSAVTVGAVISGTYYPTFVNTNAGGLGLTLVTDTDINFNSATNTLTVPVVSAFLTGNVSGTAVTANFITANTQFSGFLLGNVSGTALTANFITANTQFNGTLVGFLSGNASGTAATFTNIYGNFVGTATTASAVTIGSVASGTYYPTFVNVNTAAIGLTLVTDPQISFDSATNTLTSNVFSGFLTGNVSGTAVTATFLNGFLQNNVSGTAVTANFITANTQFTGFLSGNVTGTAVTANFVTANTQFTGFLSGNASGTALTANFITANTQFNGTLVGFLSGNASGTAATYANFYGNFVGAASTASAITIGSVATGTYYPAMVNSSSAAVGLTAVTDPQLSFNSATNTLTTDIFTGFLSGNVSGTAATASFVTANTQFTGFLSGNVSGTAVTANFITANTQFTGTLVGFHSGNASGTAATYTNFYGNFVGLASTASAVTVGSVAAGTYYPTFVNVNTAAVGLTIVTDPGINYNSATNNLTTDIFTGFLSGNVSGNAVTASFGTFTTLNASLTGTATTAANIYVSNAASQNATHYMLFSNPATSTSGLAVSSNTSLSYNPSTNLLTTGLVNVTSTTALSSGTYLTITTNATDDNSTSDFFIRALNSSSTSKFSVDANGNLRATTKSFDIEHPTKPGKRLVYGVLEGPEHGVYHRGTVEGKGIVQVDLPEYWHKLIGDQYTIQLTPWGNYNVHIVEKTNDFFTIRLVGDPLSRALKTIKVDYIVHGSRLDAPLKIEQD